MSVMSPGLVVGADANMGSGFRVWVQGLGFRVQGLGFMFYGKGFFGFRVNSLLEAQLCFGSIW